MKILLVGEGASELHGALETLVRRLGMADAAIEFDRVSNPQIHAHHGKGQGYFKRAVRWMLEAQKRDYDALILVIDEDGNFERLQEFASAQEYANTRIRRALGVAVKTFDAWMLADEKALTSVLGCNVTRQPQRETIVDPKRVCRDLFNESERSLSPREMYAEIAEHIDIAVLKDRCQKGFTPFAQRVASL